MAAYDKAAPRILLSIPHMGSQEQSFVQEAFRTNWVSTVGPNIVAFEREMEEHFGAPTVALSSGTAAIHLGLRLAGVTTDDDVFCQSLTFVATANPIRYLNATPVFIDSERTTWNLDPALLADSLARRARRGAKMPRAVVVVGLFGQCAQMDQIAEICRRYEVVLVEDAAEALGATYKGRPAGTLGDVGAVSFNGNKIISTAGGGMLVSRNREWIERARFWSTQAKDPGIGYSHSEVGFNYRMSNVLAGIGRGQIRVLSDRVSRRRAIAMRYRDVFRDIPGISVMPQAKHGLHTNWLSCVLIDRTQFGCSRDEIIDGLAEVGIETRPVWTPMHRQPLYQDCEMIGGEVADDLANRGLCLPSSSSLSLEDQLYVVNQIRSLARVAAVRHFHEAADPQCEEQSLLSSVATAT